MLRPSSGRSFVNWANYSDDSRRTYDIPTEEAIDEVLVKSLSKREKEVFAALAKGERNIDIALRLNLSQKSVSTYRSRVLEKLNLTNSMELANFMSSIRVM